MKHLITLLIVFAGFPLAAQEKELRLVVSKSEFTITAFRGDSAVARYPIAVGKNPGDKQRRGDNRTPVGEFRVSRIHKSDSWVHDFGDGNGPIAGAYGPWFLRLDTGRWTGIGIHGTHDPASIGTMATEGCIRLLNGDLEELKAMVAVGTRVLIVR